jgi:hypothetical protein
MPKVGERDPLTTALINEGLIPPECVSVKLVSQADSVVQLHYTVNVLPEDMAKLGRALTAAAERDNDPGYVYVSWEEYRAHRDWDRARFGMEPISDELMEEAKQALGRPRIPVDVWDYYLEAKSK